MKVVYYRDTNIGNIGSKNEDAFVLKGEWGGSQLLVGVIDCIGGNAGGNVTANLAAKSINEHIKALLKCIKYFRATSNSCSICK